MTSDDATISWRRLWSETAAVVGDRAQARWLCEVASGADGDEFRQALDEPATERMVAHLDAMVARDLLAPADQQGHAALEITSLTRQHGASRHQHHARIDALRC